MSSITPTLPTLTDIAAIAARLAALEAKNGALEMHDSARDERIQPLEEENRWLKAQLYGRSSEKIPPEERNPDQAWLFNEFEALAESVPDAPETITIPAYDRAKRGRKKLAADIPRVEVLHDLSEAQKICPTDGTSLERIGEEICEQLEVIPAQIRVFKHIRPKYACPCCHSGVKIAPLPVTLFPKSILTPSLAAHITTAKFVDGIPLYRQEPQFERMGIPLGRGTMALWMIRIGKAVYYTLGQWQKLTVFLTHGEAPMTNNRVENAIRPFALGRKGWRFSDTVKGARASANLYSLVETCKANGVEPHAYLTCLFERLPYLSTADVYESMLPWNIKRGSQL